MITFRRSLAPGAALVVFALAAAIAPVVAQRPAAQAPPKLIVVLVADQMRPDYFDRFASGLTSGLQRLARDGAVFAQAAYPYLNTVTCPGHATIGTGAFPYRHGLILNAWIERETGLTRGCTEDPESATVSYGAPAGIAEGPKNLLVPTLADQLRDRAKARVVTMSIKPRSAIALAGRKADAVVWFDDRGTWATSTAYTKTPVPFVQQFLIANPVAADANKVWELALPADRYTHSDEGVGERPPAGWATTFPHPLAGPGGADKIFYARWKSSPFADEYLARMAAAAVDSLQLGRGEGVDFLGVSFSALDAIGHSFGPDSHEVHDAVLRLDRTIGRLLDHLDTTVGKDNYVVAFSSDHGVAPIPEQVTGAGRVAARPVLDAIDSTLRRLWGPGQYAAISAYTDIYLAAGVLPRLEDDWKARAAVLDALRAIPGVAQAFTAGELDSGSARSSSDPIKRAAALSFYRPRSGDLIIVPRENWILSTAATTHGTLYPYDTRVPVIFYGAGVQRGRYESPATPGDIAPTLAALARVRFDRLDGRALTEAIAKPAARTAGRVQ
jgi:predicted AlkP superfamily pyrophosphatase or phosphodiesterase